MTPETNQPSVAAPRLNRAWWAALVFVTALFVTLALLGQQALASIMVLVFVALVLLPIGSKALTVGEGYAALNDLRRAFAALRSVDTIVLAKTGTLTAGQHKVVAVESFGAVSADEMLRLASAVEHDSQHSIARAIVSAASVKDLDDLPAARDLRSIPGVGVTAIVDGSAITIGGPSLLTTRNLQLSVDQLIRVNAENSAGQTVGYVIRNDELLGFISTSDALIEAAHAQVDQLHKLKMQLTLLSSDAQGVAEFVSGEFGLEDAFGEVLPHQRAAFFERLLVAGKKVGVVGDDFAADSAGLVQLAPSLAGLDSIVRRGLVLRQKLTQNRVAALVLTLAAMPLLVTGFANGNSTTTLVYGSVLISLSVAIAALQTRSLKR